MPQHDGETCAEAVEKRYAELKAILSEDNSGFSTKFIPYKYIQQSR